jgi:predicted phage gp36 major capsid-like protein
LVHEAIADLRSSLNESSDRLDNAWMEMLRTLHAEREALAANLASERENVTATVDVERARISADAAQIAARAVDTSWNELRKLVREALLLLILLSLILLGLPFAAGYMVGRRRRDEIDRRV